MSSQRSMKKIRNGRTWPSSNIRSIRSVERFVHHGWERRSARLRWRSVPWPFERMSRSIEWRETLRMGIPVRWGGKISGECAKHRMGRRRRVKMSNSAVEWHCWLRRKRMSWMMKTIRSDRSQFEIRPFERFVTRIRRSRWRGADQWRTRRPTVVRPIGIPSGRIVRILSDIRTRTRWRSDGARIRMIQLGTKTFFARRIRCYRTFGIEI